MEKRWIINSVFFSDIVYSEPRSKLNNLKSEYKEFSLLNFRKVEETISQKVLFLDNLWSINL